MAEAIVGVTADIHIDGGRHGGVNPATGRRTAHESTAAVFLGYCSHLVDVKADAAVIPGDVFLNGWPTAEAVEMIADGLRLLDEAAIPTIIFDGNHEFISRRPGHRSPIDHYEDISCVTVVKQAGVVTLDSGLQIVCLPWPRRIDLLGPDEMEGLTPTEIDNLTAARAGEKIEELALDVDPGRGPIMLAAHATVGDAVVGSSRRGSEMQLAELFAEPVIALADLDVEPWQYVGLGHIHRRQRMGERCEYVGSPDRLDFSDEGVPKAFSLVHLPDDGSIARVEAIDTNARRFVTVSVPEGADAQDVTDLMPADPENVIMRLDLPPGTDMALQTEARRVIEASGALLGPISNPPAPRLDSERQSVAEDVGPMEGLELWLPTQSLGEEAEARLREKAAGLIGSAEPEAPPQAQAA
jgi:DNA repair exonuclease SbcCD nuclease subunit